MPPETEAPRLGGGGRLHAGRRHRLPDVARLAGAPRPKGGCRVDARRRRYLEGREGEKMPLVNFPNGLTTRLASAQNASAGDNDLNCLDLFVDGTATITGGQTFTGAATFSNTIKCEMKMIKNKTKTNM